MYHKVILLYMYLLFFKLFSHLGYYRILLFTWFPEVPFILTNTVQPRLSWKLRCRCQSLLFCGSFLFWIFYLYFWFLLEALKSILGQLEPANHGSLSGLAKLHYMGSGLSSREKFSKCEFTWYSSFLSKV